MCTKEVKFLSNSISLVTPVYEIAVHVRFTPIYRVNRTCTFISYTGVAVLGFSSIFSRISVSLVLAKS